MKSPISTFLKACAFAALAGSALTSCSVNTDGPAMAGASHGSLGSQDMCDYYYKKDAGWTYTYQNVENVYNADGTIAATYTGANDVVNTMGFDGFAPNGDSLFRYQINYQLSTDYANGNQPPMTVNYIASPQNDTTHGAFVAPGYTVDGMVAMDKRPRPVSTDTILAGIIGFIRTRSDDFTGASSYVTETDTLWCSSHLDSVFIWERPAPGAPIVKERCIFIQNFSNNVSWTYDVINNPSPTTTCIVANKDQSMTVAGNSYDHVVNIRVKTSAVDDHDFNRENKYFACGTGNVYEYDWWYTTTDGISFTKQDFARSLISLSHQ